MADTVLTVAKVLVVVTFLAPVTIGLPVMLGVVAHDEWRRYHNLNRSRSSRRESLIAVIVMVWLLIATAVLYAGMSMKLWEEWRP